MKQHTFKDEIQFKRVLIHELGHFISNQILFEKFGHYKPIDIHIDWINNKNIYTGSIRRKVRLDIPLKERFYHYHLYDFEAIITTLYGCIFQHFYNESLFSYNNCISCSDGSYDYKFYCFAINTYALSRKRIDVLIEQHIEMLSKTELSTKLKSFNFENFINSSSSISYVYDYDFINKQQEIKDIMDIIEAPFLITHNLLREISSPKK